MQPTALVVADAAADVFAARCFGTSIHIQLSPRPPRLEPPAVPSCSRTARCGCTRSPKENGAVDKRSKGLRSLRAVTLLARVLRLGLSGRVSLRKIGVNKAGIAAKARCKRGNFPSGAGKLLEASRSHRRR